MHLRSLTLHGFKSFAHRTQFDFEPGITAIVGPNGSGKSNLADAFRWALGEQSLRSLRGRKTEDILFAGGPGRAPAGMAEVGLTFDVSGPTNRPLGGLPYQELSFVRRAYRSAENEYYVNRSRVRLREVLDLYGQIGLGLDGFGLVGQGAIDAALSLRAEDRRLLIEQAASIGHLHARLEDARARLDQTEPNLAQVTARIAESTPRLVLLERQAGQVEERAGLSNELIAGLIRWYAHLLVDPRARLAKARAARADAEAAFEVESRRVAQSQAAQQATRDRLAKAERETATREATLAERRAELTRLDSLLAVIAERRRSAAQRHEESLARIEQLRGELDQEAITLNNLHRDCDALIEEDQSVNRALTEANQRAQTWQNERQSLLAAIEAARRSVAGLESRRAAANGRLHSGREHLAGITQARSDHEARLAQLIRECAERQDHLAALHPPLAEARRVLDEATAAREQATERLSQAQAAARAASGRLAALDREVQVLRSRVDARLSVDESGSGYFAGVRTVLRAASGREARRLPGIIGVVAKLIEVSAAYEIAIETALGGHAQDVVVERWADAEHAIAYLKQSGAGRATFLPLDTLRPSRRNAPEPGEGVIGVAASLVSIEPRLRIIAEFLLGQTLLVESLAVTRRILRDYPPAWQIVTLDGDLSRTTGVVTGGAPTSNRGSLQRHRELREDQRALAERGERRSHLIKEADQARQAEDESSAQLVDVSRHFRTAEERLRQVQVAANEAQRQLDRALLNRSWQEDELRRLSTERQKADDAVLGAVAALQAASTEHAQAIANLAVEQDRLAAFEEKNQAATAEINRMRSARDLTAGRLREITAAISRAEARCLQQRIQLQTEGDRQQDDEKGRLQLEQEHAQSAALREARSAEAEQIQARVDAGRHRLSSLREEQQALERELRRAEADAQKMRQQIDVIERGMERASAEVDALRRQVQNDLGEIDLAAFEQGTLRVLVSDSDNGGNWREAPIEPIAEAGQLRERLGLIRSRLRHLPSDPQIIAEYRAEKERLAFLDDQAADLTRTVATLRTAIDETRAAMRSQFERAFGAVSGAFERRFSELFGGGSARLRLEGEGDRPGVEILAQPPGKRAQNLAMLSGGERALTAAALLFSLIETSPPPFCVLDEVDAALDESNVSRFGNALRGLSDRTQFIVITHNRRTMEVARAIYGLTLENRSESRVLSLKLSSGVEIGG